MFQAATSIHGDKSQPERDFVLTDFRTGKSSILIATDVAARGLDVEDVKFVINYDYPNSSEDYIHRIGRTGRCQQSGTAYTFFTPGNARQARELVSVLEEAGQHPSPDLLEMARLTGGGKGRNRWPTRANPVPMGNQMKNPYNNYGNNHQAGKVMYPKNNWQVRPDGSPSSSNASETKPAHWKHPQQNRPVSDGNFNTWRNSDGDRNNFTKPNLGPRFQQYDNNNVDMQQMQYRQPRPNYQGRNNFVRAPNTFNMNQQQGGYQGKFNLKIVSSSHSIKIEMFVCRKSTILSISNT